MSLNATPSSERPHIGFFGRRNAGKSSVVNKITGQELALVSDVKGTTTDPVYKTMELLPLGPVVIIDTAGIDDEGMLGNARIQKTLQVLNKTDIAVIILDATIGITSIEEAFIQKCTEKSLPYILVYNKADLIECKEKDKANEIHVSALTGMNIEALKEKIAHFTTGPAEDRRLIGDLLSPQDHVVLVVPIDSAAPKGRLILPQQQVLRDVLDAHAFAVVVQDAELRTALSSLSKPPKIVVTDSQAFASVSSDTPSDILLTSFSILMARYKGNLETAVRGAKVLETLKEGDKILISEGCTHHRQCDDIGTVKLPRWIKEYIGKELQYAFTSGREFPEDLSEYALVIHCGGCMLNEREMQYRYACAKDQGTPITNYGICIAYMQGILKRSVEIFPDIYQLLDSSASNK